MPWKAQNIMSLKHEFVLLARQEGDIKTVPETGSLGGTCAGHVR